jgi:hypothetical protein
MCILAPRNMTRMYFLFGPVAETGHGGVSEHLRYTIWFCHRLQGLQRAFEFLGFYLVVVVK